MDFQHSRSRILRYWTDTPDWRCQTNRKYRAMRIGAVERDLACRTGRWSLQNGYSPMSHSTWVRRFADTVLPVGACLWYRLRSGGERILVIPFRSTTHWFAF